METKFYARRDSATTVLRKMGIHQRDYNAFITTVDGGFDLNLTAANAHATDLKKRTRTLLDDLEKFHSDTKTTKPAAKTSRKIRPELSSSKIKLPTVSSVARGMILAGKTNEEIWSTLKQDFNLDDAKRGYPAWYRRDMKLKGMM